MIRYQAPIMESPIMTNISWGIILTGTKIKYTRSLKSDFAILIWEGKPRKIGRNSLDLLSAVTLTYDMRYANFNPVHQGDTQNESELKLLDLSTNF